MCLQDHMEEPDGAWMVPAPTAVFAPGSAQMNYTVNSRALLTKNVPPPPPPEHLYAVGRAGLIIFFSGFWHWLSALWQCGRKVCVTIPLPPTRLQ